MSERPPLHKIDTGHTARIAVWHARTLVFAVTALAAVAIAEATVIISLFPLKEVEPVFVSAWGKEDQVLKIEPFETDADGFSTYVESLVRGYVSKRETIDLQTEPIRYEEVGLMSNLQVFNDFQSLVGFENKDSPLLQAQQRKLTRTIEIVTSSQITPRIYQVEYITTDASELGKVLDKRRFLATVTFVFSQQRVQSKNRFVNPFGLTVTAYTIAEKPL